MNFLFHFKGDDLNNYEHAAQMACKKTEFFPIMNEHLSNNKQMLLGQQH